MVPVGEQRVAEAPSQGGGAEQHEEEVKQEAVAPFLGGGRELHEEIKQQAPPPRQGGRRHQQVGDAEVAGEVLQGASRRAGLGQGQGPRRGKRCQAQKANLTGM